MTPQSTFMILATIVPEREAELRALLDSMNLEPGLANAKNTVVPFGEFDQLHFARIVILDDQTLDDIEVYGLPRVDYPTYLAILGDLDGPVDELFKEMIQRAADGLRRIFRHCDDFGAAEPLLDWMKAHNVPPAANYVNWAGRTVKQVKEEENLHLALERYLRENSASLLATRPRQARDALKAFVAAEQESGRVVLTKPDSTPWGWQVRNFVNLVGIPILLLIASPLLLIALPFFLVLLRWHELSDPEVAPRVDPAHADLLSSLEDHDVTNQFSAMGSLKPGWFRRLTIGFVLGAIDYTARHVFNRGRLARVTTIQFARWVYLDGKKRVIFLSNYDGSLESYMDDFINKVGFGLNIVFSNGLGYPRTNWLVLDGAKDEQAFKDYLRRHQIPTQFWYNAFPGLTAHDKRRNALIREGLEKGRMTDSEIEQWLRLF